jgi:hypothetical protein
MNEKSDIVILETHYLPCITYFRCLSKFEDIIFEVQENYVKQSHRNRCYILGANKVLPLSVPVHRGTGKILTKDIKIDYSQKWVSNHWRAIKSAYGKAPFFEFYADQFHDILCRKRSFLIDLNWELLTYCLKALYISEKKFSFSISYEKDQENGIYDARNQLNPQPKQFEKGFFPPYIYEQVFGKNFVPNLSIIDLLFCTGPNAESYVINSAESDRERQKLQGH